MRETPDFEAIALRLAYAFGFPGEGDVTTQIREAIIDAWNARGAADIVKLEAELTSMMGGTASGPYVKNLDRALRGLDR